MPWKERRLVSGFLDSNLARLRLKILSVQVVPPQVTRMKHGESSRTLQRAPTKHHFGDRWQVRPLAWNTPAISKGRLVAHLREVCASTAHRHTVSVLADKTTAVVLHPPYLPDLTPYNMFSLKRSYEGVLSRMPLKFKKNRWRSYMRFPRSVPAEFPAVAVSLAPVHIIGTGLPWRGERWPIIKVNFYIVNDPFQQLLDTP
jgi:hypothetical protein